MFKKRMGLVVGVGVATLLWGGLFFIKNNPPQSSVAENPTEKTTLPEENIAKDVYETQDEESRNEVTEKEVVSPSVLSIPPENPNVKTEEESMVEVVVGPNSNESLVENNQPPTAEIVSSSLGLSKKAITTVFWVGEEADHTNDYIANSVSAWDIDWLANYGGYDNPHNRCGYHPCQFTPKENPFYFALPYNDYSLSGSRSEDIEKIPWYFEPKARESLLKNRWIKVESNNKVCYGQWQDVGPNETHDFAYVFGSVRYPHNTFGVKAGLDISPALRDCLGVGGVSETFWQFVEASKVPAGPWTEIITTSQVNW